MLLPALQSAADVTAFSSAEGYRAADYDVAIYQLGNNPHHEFVYAEAMRNPGVAVLHDLVLHHLIVEMTLARGDVEGYVTALRANHGDAGAAWARGRAAGLHSEMGNFLLPASVQVVHRSRSVIVHNGWAADRLRSFGVTTPVHVVPHPYEPDRTLHDRAAIRAELGFAPTDRVFGLFGFLTSAKRAEVVIEAFREARRTNAGVRLLVVGEPAPNIELSSLAGAGVTITGYVNDEDFGRYYAATDRLVNLRYPSAGESSGTLIRAFAAGKPVAVSDYAQFAEFPDDVVVKIPFGASEVMQLVGFFNRDLDVAAIASAQRAWLERHSRLDLTVSAYMTAVASATKPRTEDRGPRTGRAGGVPLFPRLSLAGVEFDSDLAVVTLRNDGESPLRARVYGEPAFRILAKLFSDAGEVADHWLQIDGDLAPGAATAVRIPLPLDAVTLRIYPVLEGIPVVDPVPAAEIEITRV